ncbi:prolipoprotein diacylglyceryl transferase [candidate division KSB1 bacterium]|nr:prolipoprotein diacylglyceryl transferase [candidate division KSB1 bacterium]
MHPVLFKIGPLEIHSYGFMLAISFLLGIFLAMHRAKKQGIDPGFIMDLAVVIVVSAILGARFLYVIFHLEEFQGHWLDTINPFQSNGQIGIAGLTMLGGFLAALFATLYYIRLKKQPVLKVTDIMAPSMGLGIFITRIGCFLNGCCYGMPTKSSFGMVFSMDSPAGYHFPNIPIHPTQLYSSFYGLVILVTLLFVERWKKFDGFLLYVFLILYGISRFTIDMFRYYEESMVLLKLGSFYLSVNQGISITMILTGAGLIFYNLVTKETINK